MPLYRVTKLFIGGLLAGLTYTVETRYPFPVGWECLLPYGNTSPYRIVECVQIA